MDSTNCLRWNEPPTQMDAATGEACNMDCDYCFVNKSHAAAMDLGTLRRGLEAFAALPWRRGTVTFTTCEPLLRPAFFRAAVDYLYAWMERSGRDLRLVATTNGLNLNSGIRRYVESLDRRFQLNLSLDGGRLAHDAHRRLRASPRSGFELSWRNVSALKKKGRARAIMTVAPDQAPSLEANARFIRDEGFGHVDVFPQMLALWSPESLSALDQSLGLLVEEANRPGSGLELRLLNRLWGPSHYSKVLLAADGRFYLFEWVLTWPYSRRRHFIIGDVENGLDLRRREALFSAWMSRLEAALAGRCRSCALSRVCGYPLPLYLWSLHRRESFSAHLESFCRIAEIFVRRSAQLELRRRNPLDEGKLKALAGTVGAHGAA